MIVFAPIALVQTINVTVDGEVIAFVGQPPVERSGMVLVPLRGVFEKLGASVLYDGPSRSIRALKGSTEVTLRLGSTEAFVNGRRQTLALPAQTEQGTTLVPLRFVSEALGARVDWRGASKTVVISTTGGVAVPAPVPAAAVEVFSFTHDSVRALRSGEKLTTTLRGTPGSTATFSISGVESARELRLTEQTPGEYTGSFAIPAGVQIKNAPLFAVLKKGTISSPTIQAGQPVSIDGIAPQLANLSPAQDTTARPESLLIYGTLTDVGTGIDQQSLHLLVNGVDVTSKTTVTEAFFSYRPEPALAAGKTKALVVAKDYAGNETRREWSFNIGASASPPVVALVKPTILTPKEGAAVGERLEITGRAAPGAKVHYRLTFQGMLVILPTEGVVSEGDVKADAAGVWKVPEIRLTTPLGVSKLSYTLVVNSIGAKDMVSDPVTVSFKK